MFNMVPTPLRVGHTVRLASSGMTGTGYMRVAELLPCGERVRCEWVDRDGQPCSDVFEIAKLVKIGELRP